MSLSPLSSGLIQFRDPATDKPVRNGFVYAIDPVTGNPAEVWADHQGSIPYIDGVIRLNNNGEAYIYGNQIYSLRVTDSCDRLVMTYSPVGFSPILTPGVGALVVGGGETVDLLPENLVNGKLYNFMTVFVEVEDLGVKNDIVINIPLELNDILATGAIIRFIRVNASGNTFGDSGFAFTVTGIIKLGFNANFLPSCGVINSELDICELTKDDENSYWLTGQLDSGV